MTTLGEICFQDRKAALGSSSRLPYLGLEQIESQTGRIITESPSDESRNGIGAAFRFDSRHVLYSKLRPYLNKVALPKHEGRCSTELIPLLPADGVERDFLALLLRSPDAVAHASSANNGARMPRADLAHLFAWKVSVPSLSVQRRIASRLKVQMAAVEGARQAVEVAYKTLPSLLGKTITDSFQGITPLSVGRDEALPPKGWRWHLLIDFAQLATGHTPSRRSPEYWADGNIPWLALPDIRALDCRVATESSEKTNAKGIANSSARVLPPGTVALSRTASVGYVTIFGREMATSQDFVNWVCGPSLHAPFLLWLLRASRDFIKGLSTGAVHQTVYMDVVERFRVCLPDLPTQQKTAARLDEAFRTIQQLQSAHKAQLEALDKLPGAYLREAFGSLTTV